MPKTRTFNFYSDPGHAWMKVERSLVNQLGVQSKISSYSYQRGEHVYLEEDCDAFVVVGAMRDRGYEVKFREFNANKLSKIRGYDSYRPSA